MRTSPWVLTEAEQTTARSLLTELIRRQSPDPPGNETAVASYLLDWFRARGFITKFDEFRPDRINVLARLPGGNKPSLIFSAHMDTMPVGEGNWKFNPFAARIDAGKLYGRGAADMKSGLTAMAVAASKIKASATPLAGDLILAFSAGESSSCIGAKRMIEQGDLLGAGALLVSEPSSLDLIIAETGAIWLKVTTTGTPGHASSESGDGENAILKIMDFLNKVRAITFDDHHHALLGKASLAINTIEGGSAVNLTPDIARAMIDIRTVPGMTTDLVLNKLNRIAGSGVILSVDDDKPPIITNIDDPFITLCQKAIVVIRGCSKEPGGVSYYSDSCILAPALGVPRAIIGPGLIGMSGRRDEWVELADVYDAASIFAEVAAAYLQ